MTDQIRQARELGDVTDNAAYEAAKQDQALLEGRIARLEDILSTAEVRDTPVDAKVVSPGVLVTVRDRPIHRSRTRSSSPSRKNESPARGFSRRVHHWAKP